MDNDDRPRCGRTLSVIQNKQNIAEFLLRDRMASERASAPVVWSLGKEASAECGMSVSTLCATNGRSS